MYVFTELRSCVIDKTKRSTIAENVCEMTRDYKHTCVRAPHPDDSLSFTCDEVTRHLHSRCSTKQANSSDHFVSEIAACACRIVVLSARQRRSLTRFPLISASLMRWPSSRDGTREISTDITMRRDVSWISLFSAIRTRHKVRNKNRRTRQAKEGALHRRQGKITQLRSFPLELFLRFHVGMDEDGGGLARLPVILLRNSDNAAAAMNNGRITRRKSENVFFRAVPKPAGTFESPYRPCLTFHRYQQYRSNAIDNNLQLSPYIHIVSLLLMF